MSKPTGEGRNSQNRSIYTASAPEAPYTPTQDEFVVKLGNVLGINLFAFPATRRTAASLLAAHDAEVKAAGKREGWDEGFEVAVNKARALASMTPNPYSKEHPAHIVRDTPEQHTM